MSVAERAVRTPDPISKSVFRRLNAQEDRGLTMDEHRLNDLLTGLRALIGPRLEVSDTERAVVETWCRELLEEIEAMRPGPCEVATTELVESKPEAVGSPVEPAAAVVATPAEATPAEPEPRPEARPLPPLRIGSAGSWVPGPGEREWTPDQVEGHANIDLESLAKRLAVKADACRWQDSGGHDRDELERLKVRSSAWRDSGGCYLWPIYGKYVPDASLEHFELVYRTLGRIITAIDRLPEDDFGSGKHAELLKLAARANKMIRHEGDRVKRSEGPLDSDDELHGWLRQMAGMLDVFIFGLGLADVVTFEDLPSIDAEFERVRKSDGPRNLLNRIAQDVKNLDMEPFGGRVDWLARIRDNLNALADQGYDVKSGGVRVLLGEEVLRSLLEWDDVGGQCLGLLRSITGEPKTSDAVTSAEPGPDRERLTIQDLLDRLERDHGEDVVIKLNGASNLKAQFEDLEQVEKALRWLATDYVAWRRGERVGTPKKTVQHEIKDLCGSEFFYSEDQADTTVGKYRDDYRTQYGDRWVAVHEHIGKGGTARNRPIRVSFAWMPDLGERGRVLIGYVGPHQTTDSSN